jgi:hypothetical protein
LLLAQIPLTVSPFISLPTATTLPYTYKSLPSTLPRSSIGDANGGEKPKYVVSSSGHAAHPDEILESCRTLQAHLQKLQDDADRTLQEWEASIRERDLAEKRRIAPGWLDREERILQPGRKSIGNTLGPVNGSQGTIQSKPAASDLIDIPETTTSKEGEDIDRAFGGLNIK